MQSYTVQRGDTLGRIAKRFYGDPSRFTLIASANAIANPDRLKVGQRLEIPERAPVQRLVPAPAAPAPALSPPAAPAFAANVARLNDRRLTGVHPALAERARRLLELAAAEELALLVTQGLRTFEEQDALFAKGRTTKPIGRAYYVTKAKGGQSWHNFGLAFDVVVLDATGKEAWSYKHPGWARAGALGKSVGLSWGGDWKGFKDYPHFEYTCTLSLVECRQQYAAGLSSIWERIA